METFAWHLHRWNDQREPTVRSRQCIRVQPDSEDITGTEYEADKDSDMTEGAVRRHRNAYPRYVEELKGALEESARVWIEDSVTSSMIADVVGVNGAGL